MQSSLADISEKVFLKRPVLKQILEKHGKKTLFEYSSSFLDAKPAISSERKNEFIGELASEAARVLGEEAGKRVTKQLSHNYFVSTADHLGPLSHPFFLHSNLLAGLNKADNLSDWIVLACSNISLNNSSYPRGVQFHVLKDSVLKLNSFSFFPSALRHSPVYNMPAYTVAYAEKFKNCLDNSLHNAVPEKSIQSVYELFSNKQILDLSDYGDQVTLINSRVFQKFLPGDAAPLDLVYLNQERLTAKLLEHHFYKKTDIYRLLFESEYREAVLTLFEGIPGAFSFRESKGTFLFWGYDFKKRLRLSLMENKGNLQTSDGAFKVHIDPESVSQALKQGTLIPSMLVNMLVVAGYYGVKCLGGFSQVSYLTWILEAYKKMFPEAIVANSQTLFSDFIFADIVAGNTGAAAVTGLDMMLYTKQLNPGAFVELCKTKTLSEVMSRVMPILFRILYPNEKKYSWPLHAYRPDFSIDPDHAYPVIKL